MYTAVHEYQNTYCRYNMCVLGNIGQTSKRVRNISVNNANYILHITVVIG